MINCKLIYLIFKQVNIKRFNIDIDILKNGSIMKLWRVISMYGKITVSVCSSKLTVTN
jgi:hypothetical protein